MVLHGKTDKLMKNYNNNKIMHNEKKKKKSNIHWQKSTAKGTSL